MIWRDCVRERWVIVCGLVVGGIGKAYLKELKVRLSGGSGGIVSFSSQFLGSSVVSLKFDEEQLQILRLTTPELKDVRGPDHSE